MGGKEQVEYWPEDNDAYIRAKWFKEGYGRAYLGYTEAMSNMGDYTNNLDFKVISYCKEDNIPVFYGDVVGVNSKIDNEKKDAAIKLANVIGNTETMVKAVSPDNNNPHPQYLLPARKSVYQTMGNVYPIYNELYTIDFPYFSILQFIIYRMNLRKFVQTFLNFFIIACSLYFV